MNSRKYNFQIFDELAKYWTQAACLDVSHFKHYARMFFCASVRHFENTVCRSFSFDTQGTPGFKYDKIMAKNLQRHAESQDEICWQHLALVYKVTDHIEISGWLETNNLLRNNCANCCQQVPM